MVTNHPHLIASHENAMRATAGDGNADGLGGRVIERLRQMFCGIGGHDTMLHLERDRMSLRCVSCGHETPGWELNEAPPTVTIRGDSRRPALAPPHLIGVRKIA
jgi:hypothetical protein